MLDPAAVLGYNSPVREFLGQPDLLLCLAAVSMVMAAAWLAHFTSYRWIKQRVLRERRWDYNICCGATDGGGINADIVRHADLPNSEIITDVTRLPHRDREFKHLLCSHTIEHVPDPDAMFRELRRIGENVTLLVPPLWDFTAAFNPFEHQVIFFSLRSRHDNHLPRHIQFAPARWLQSRLGQRIKADALPPGRTGARARLLAALSPVGFLSAAGLAFAANPLAWWIWAASIAAWWLSK